MIAALQNIATITGLSTVPRHLFLKETGLSEREVYKSFGTYNDLVEAAGLKPRYFPTPDAPTYSDSDLLKEIVRVLRLPESKLTRIFFEQNAVNSRPMYTSHSRIDMYHQNECGRG